MAEDAEMQPCHVAKLKEVDSYHTWPDRSKLSMEPGSSGGKLGASVSCMNTVTMPMTMEAALEQLNISYSPVSQCLGQTSPVSSGNVVYKPGHRKAYSLPRTLETVDDAGAITHSKLEHDVTVESPRTTLQRYGIAYEPYNFRQDDTVSSVSGVSAGVSDLSSLGDSGIFSDVSDKSKAVRKGLGELLSKAANFRLFSKSSPQQQSSGTMSTRGINSHSSCTSISSQCLIMEARPPGVPSKNADEEEKHKQEHKAMMERMRKKEETDGRTRAHKMAEKQRAEDDLSQLTSSWQHSILPHWSTQARSRRTLALWWRGLPPPVRGRVWRLATENTLNITPQLYSILVKRAQEQLSSSASHLVGREETLELIRLDVSRTFPPLCIFQEGGPYYTLLHNVLSAYVCYRPDIGYVQGMSFIAAILILNLDEADAFIMFANLLNMPLLTSFFTMDQVKMTEHYTSFKTMLSTCLPQLNSHFSRIHLHPDMYLMDWIMTLFSKCSPLDVTCRIWDVIIRDGETFLFKAALGILALYQEHLLQENDFVHIAQFLSKLPDDINCDLLFQKIEAYSIFSSKKTLSLLASSLW